MSSIEKQVHKRETLVIQNKFATLNKVDSQEKEQDNMINKEKDIIEKVKEKGYKPIEETNDNQQDSPNLITQGVIPQRILLLIRP